MSTRKREIAKFFAGVGTMETVLHWALGCSDVLPLTLLGVTITRGSNAVAMVAWPVATWLFFCYGWLKSGAGGTGA